MRKIVPFSFYFIFFAGVASFGPYRVLYFQSLNFTGAQIGLLVGIAPLITVISLPIITGLADRTNKHRLIMSLALLIIVSALIVYPYVETFAILLVLTILYTIFFSSIMPLSASATMFMLGSRRDLFGRMRVGGTIGFSIAATVIGTFVEDNGLKIAFWSAAVLFFIAFLISQKMVHSEDVDEENNQPEDSGRASELLKNPHFLLFLLLGFSGGLSSTTLNTYLFPYMKELGAGESVMGLALTFGTLVEVPVLFFVSRFIQRFKAYPVVIFSIVMTALRFLLMAVATTPTFVLFIQLLNGFNHPLLTVAGVTYADENAPKRFRATAQGLFNAAMGGIGSAVGGFTGGLLFESIGAKGMYLCFGIFIVFILIFVSLLRRILPPEKRKTQSEIAI